MSQLRRQDEQRDAARWTDKRCACAQPIYDMRTGRCRRCGGVYEQTDWAALGFPAASSEIRAACKVLCAPALRWKDIKQYCHGRQGYIDFPAMLKASQSWSHGERLLVQTAAELYSSGAGGSLPLGDLIRVLDTGNWQAVCDGFFELRQTY